jgi:hypothetical protein
MEGQKVAYAKIKAAYDASGHPERLKIVVAEKSGHTVTPAQRDAMYAWFEQWLKGHAAAAK